MTDKAELRARRAKLEADLAALDREEESFKSLSPMMQLADGLHSLNCHFDHTEMCDWYYGEWTDSSLRHSRKQYLEQAEHLEHELNYGEWGFGVNVEQILELAKLFKG